MTVRRVRLTGRAARWVQLLQDYGHLDHAGSDRLMMGIVDLHPQGPSPGNLVADLPLVRRAAAVLLFPEGTQAGPTVLDDDWSLLFS